MSVIDRPGAIDNPSISGQPPQPDAQRPPLPTAQKQTVETSANVEAVDPSDLGQIWQRY